MLSNIKTRKTKKQVRKQRIQKGGAASAASAASAARQKSPLTNRDWNNILGTSLTLTKLDQIPPAPHHIPYFTIKVSVKELQELNKIFIESKSPDLNKLIDLYTNMHDNISRLKPEDIMENLQNANEVFRKMIELLRKTYINIRGGNPEKAMQADKWCDYIKKLIYLNIEDISKIYLFQA